METRLNRTEALQFLNRLGYGGASGFMADFAFEWVKAAPKRKKGLKGQDKVGAVLHEFKHGTLHSSSGKKVTDRQQAIAIAMSEAGLSKAQVRVKPHMTKTKRGKIVPVVGYTSERQSIVGWKPTRDVWGARISVPIYEPQKVDENKVRQFQEVVTYADKLAHGFEKETTEDGTVIYSTRESGSVGEGTPGVKDSNRAKKIAKELRTKFPNLNIYSGTLDEWTDITLEYPRAEPVSKISEPQESYGQPKVAMTIAQQMGGIGRLKTMTGARNFIDHGNALSFEFPTNKGKPNYVKITLGQDDTYSMEFGRKRPTSVSAMAKLPDNATAEDFKNLVYTKLYEANGVYLDDLQDIFEKRTGLYLHL